MATVLEVTEGLQFQSTAEELIWAIDTSNRGTPTSPSVASVKDKAGADKKSDVMPSGSASVSGDVISLPKLQDLTAGDRYEIRVTYTISGNKHETFIHVACPS